MLLINLKNNCYFLFVANFQPSTVKLEKTSYRFVFQDQEKLQDIRILSKKLRDQRLTFESTSRSSASATRLVNASPISTYFVSSVSVDPPMSPISHPPDSEDCSHQEARLVKKNPKKKKKRKTKSYRRKDCEDSDDFSSDESTAPASVSSDVSTLESRCFKIFITRLTFYFLFSLTWTFKSRKLRCRNPKVLMVCPRMPYFSSCLILHYC